MKWPVIACLATSSLFGSCECIAEDCCCVEEDRCGAFRFGGYWLWMRPLVSPIEYARVFQETSTDPQVYEVERECLKTKFHSGYEFFASYRGAIDCGCAWDIKGSILSHEFSGKTKLEVEDPRFIIPLMGFIFGERDNAFFSAVGKNYFDLTLINGEVGWNLLSCYPQFLRLFAGVSYTDLKQCIKISYTDPVFTVTTQNQQTESIVEQRSKFSGIGPRVGINADWTFCRGIHLFGELAGNILFAKTSGELTQASFIAGDGSTQEQINFRTDESFCHGKKTIPSLDLRVGLGVKLISLSCFYLSIEGGYRAVHYFDAFQLLKIASSGFSGENVYAESPTWMQDENYGLTGWFVGGSFGF